MGELGCSQAGGTIVSVCSSSLFTLFSALFVSMGFVVATCAVVVCSIIITLLQCIQQLSSFHSKHPPWRMQQRSGTEGQQACLVLMTDVQIISTRESIDLRCTASFISSFIVVQSCSACVRCVQCIVRTDTTPDNPPVPSHPSTSLLGYRCWCWHHSRWYGLTRV